jgi:ribosomal protein S18 acetylase RimI-like enzyme
LLEANKRENGGSLSANFSSAQISAMLNDMPIIVACNESIIGFIMTSTRTMNADVPIIAAMFAAYQNCAVDAYVYGPICVDAEARGQGLAETMFKELRRVLPAREGVLFIRCDNVASLRAHARMGMSEVASFIFQGDEHLVFSYRG